MDNMSRPPKRPLPNPPNPSAAQPIEPDFNNTHMPEKKPKRLWLKIMIGLALSLLVALAGLVLWYQYNLSPVSGEEIATEFKIEPGEGAVVISDRLQEKQLVRSSVAFQVYLRGQGDSANLRAGTYLLSPSLSAKEVAAVLIDGKIAQKLVTITPGLRLDEIEDQLVKQGFERKAVKTAMNSVENPFSPTASLEGYIAPESYSLDLDAEAEEVISQAVQQFKAGVDDDLQTTISRGELSLTEAITLASIVQGETDSAEQQKKVARVFLNRLAEDMPLGADPTFRYAAYLEGVPESPTVDSPYNTRLYKGLPPGPISNFKLSALKAVAEPDDHKFLYFVTGDDGKFHYSMTLKEHEDKVDKYCIKLCKL